MGLKIPREYKISSEQYDYHVIQALVDQLSVEQALSCVKIPPHAYIHAFPCMRNSHFNATVTFQFPRNTQGRCPKGKTCRLITMPPLHAAFDFSLNEKRLEECSYTTTNRIKFPAVPEMCRFEIKV